MSSGPYSAREVQPDLAIHYLSDVAATDEYVLRLIDRVLRGSNVVSLDLEYGQTGDKLVHLLQIADEQEVLLVHLAAFQPLAS